MDFIMLMALISLALVIGGVMAWVQEIFRRKERRRFEADLQH